MSKANRRSCDTSLLGLFVPRLSESDLVGISHKLGARVVLGPASRGDEDRVGRPEAEGEDARLRRLYDKARRELGNVKGWKWVKK